MAQNLVAGRELDKLIASQIIGLPDHLISLHGTFYKGHAVRGIQHYSTDIGDAWDVIDILKERGWDVTITTNRGGLTQVDLMGGNAKIQDHRSQFYRQPGRISYLFSSTSDSGGIKWKNISEKMRLFVHIVIMNTKILTNTTLTEKWSVIPV